MLLHLLAEARGLAAILDNEIEVNGIIRDT
jgi:hypothetical protein